MCLVMNLHILKWYLNYKDSSWKMLRQSYNFQIDIVSHIVLTEEGNSKYYTSISPLFYWAYVTLSIKHIPRF